MTAETERLRMLEIARCRARAEMNAERANPRGGDPLFVIARDRAPHGTPADWDAIVEANRWVRRRFERLGSLVWKQRDTIQDLHYFLVLATLAALGDAADVAFARNTMEMVCLQTPHQSRPFRESVARQLRRRFSNLDRRDTQAIWTAFQAAAPRLGKQLRAKIENLPESLGWPGRIVEPLGSSAQGTARQCISNNYCRRTCRRPSGSFDRTTSTAKPSSNNSGSFTPGPSRNGRFHSDREP